MPDHPLHFPPFRKGRTTRLEELRHISAVAHGVEGRAEGLPSSLHNDGGFWAVITGTGSGAAYSAAELAGTSTDSGFNGQGVLELKVGGIVADATGVNGWPAKEINGNLSVPINTPVRLYFQGAGPCWVFSCPPIPGGSPPPGWTEVAVLTSNVPAMTSLTPGSGTAQQYKMSGSTLVNLGLGNITVYNDSLTISYLSGAVVNLIVEPISGDWFITGGSLTNVSNLTVTNLTVVEFNITPISITLNSATYNNYSVAGMSKLRITANAPGPAISVSIYGFTPGVVDGQILILWNDGPQPIWLYDSSPSAPNGSKIVTPLPTPNGYWVLGVGSGVILEYDAIGDGTYGYWRFDESTFMCINIYPLGGSVESYQCRSISFNNDLGDDNDYNFGRIHGTNIGGADTTLIQLDWQGVLGYSASLGPLGPQPNIEIDGDETTIDAALSSNATNHSLKWVLSTIGATENIQLVQTLSFDSGACVLTYTTATLEFYKGLYQGHTTP